MTKFCVSLYFLLIFNVLMAQKSSYDIIAFDKVVGEATMTKVNLEKEQYSLDYTFDADVKVLFVRTVIDMDVHVLYKKNQLLEASVYYQTNDKKFTRKYKWIDNYYKIKSNGNESILDKKIQFSVMNFYEKEPIGIDEVFLEKQNEFVALENLGDHQYSIVVDGDKCTYTYKDGMLQELYIDGMINILLKRKQ